MMKKFIATVFLSITFLSPTPTHAIFGVGDIVFDPSVYGNAILQYANMAKDLVFSGAGYELDYILNPLANQLASMILQRFQNDTIRWINNGFRGGGPAYILNPKAYFNNIANRAIEQQLSSIQGTNNIFGNGIIGAVIQSTRTGKAPTGAQLQYTLASTVQSSICNEANITEMATQQVDSSLSAGATTGSRQSRINAQKNVLYRQLCSTGASMGASQQQVLANAFSNNFAVGGWGAWLDLGTNPNNTQYGATVRASQLIAQEVNQKQTTAKEKMVNGVMPQEKCTKFDTVSINDQAPGTSVQVNTEDSPCAETTVEVPAQTVAESIASVVNSGPNKIANSTTFGSVITSVLISSMTKLFSGKPSAGNGGGLNSSSVTQVNVSQGSDGRYRIGTTGDVPGGTGVATPISGTVSTTGLLGILNSLKATLSATKNISNDIITLINSYNNDLRVLDSCYDSTATTGVDVASGKQYVASSISANSGVLTNATLDNNDVDGMITMVNGFITYLNNTPTPEAATSIAQQYTDAKSNNSLFDKSKELELQQQYDTLSSNITKDRTDNLTPKLQQCQAGAGTSWRIN